MDPWLARCRAGAKDPIIRRVAALRGSALFDRVEGEALASLAAVADVVPQAAAHGVVREAQPGDSLYVVLSGSYSVVLGEKSAGELSPGDAFGELSLIDGHPRGASNPLRPPRRLPPPSTETTSARSSPSRARSVWASSSGSSVGSAAALTPMPRPQRWERPPRPSRMGRWMSPRARKLPPTAAFGAAARAKPTLSLSAIPRAGGRWKELADILDSEEASHARRIVTDSVEDIAPALSEIGRKRGYCGVYGGDGTIQRVIDRLHPGKEEESHIALLGGGTMNVTSRWLGFGRSPGKNFRYVVNGFRSGDLLLKEVPLLEVRAGGRTHRGFTFGIGPIVRLLDAYERGEKSKAAALRLGVQSMMAAWFKRGSYRELLEEMHAELFLDGERLPYDHYSAVFANVTGQINPGIEPFKENRTRDSFYTAAYAVSAREFALALPFIARGLLPIDIQDDAPTPSAR